MQVIKRSSKDPPMVQSKKVKHAEMEEKQTDEVQKKKKLQIMKQVLLWLIVEHN